MKTPLHPILCLLSLGLLLTACQPETPDAEPAFYHWKSELLQDSAQIAYLQELDTRRIYLRLFDLDWNERLRSPAPIAEAQLGDFPYRSFEWVPTIFITNRSLKQLPIQETGSLARRIVDKIERMREAAGMPTVREVQIDCDWTQSTREVYFRLLKECKHQLSNNGAQLSVTVRLHQLRYPEQTGVPPADRGMLMYYNMGEVRSWEEHNSILNLEAAAPYLQADPYPLPLDLALPLFRWGVVFREGKMIRLINDLNQEDLQDRSRFFPMTGKRYEVVKGTFLQGHYLYQGDLIRLENVTHEALQDAVAQLQRLKWPAQFHLAFYHLDSNAVNNYPPVLLKALENQLETRP